MKSDSRPGRFVKWAVLAPLVLLVIVVASGFFIQLETDSKSRTEHPYTGDFVEVDGHHLHYREHGAGGFTFVLEPDIGDYSGSWGSIEDTLAEMGRVFVYDRAGYGWSQEGPGPRTLHQLTDELHRALENARVRKPYILVGHGLGGALLSLYATQHPEYVAAMLLIDPSHKDQLRKLPQASGRHRLLARYLPMMAPLGLGRVFFRSTDPVKNRTDHIQTFGAELRAIDESMETLGDEPIDLGNIPIYVLTAGESRTPVGDSEAEQGANRETSRSLHAELVEASTSPLSRHIVVDDAGHYIHQEHPEVVEDAARELVEHIAGG